MNRSVCILGAVFLAVCTFLSAQNLRPRPVPPPIAIAVKNMPQDYKPVRVASGDAVVRICGLTAETTVTYVVKNPNPQALEGEFQFPLPPESTVTGLALDVNGVMLDAAIVPKQRAKEVFEAVERQGLDPALVEDIGANTYRARIWPIPAGGTRTIRIRFLSSIISADGEFIFTLPMRFQHKLDSMRVRIEVAEPDRKVTVSGGAFSNLEFRNWQSLVAAERTLRDIELSEDLKIAVPFIPGGTRYEKDPQGRLWFSSVRVLPPVLRAPPCRAGSSDHLLGCVAFPPDTGSRAGIRISERILFPSGIQDERHRRFAPHSPQHAGKGDPLHHPQRGHGGTRFLPEKDPL